jgi:hypothetical protein
MTTTYEMLKSSSHHQSFNPQRYYDCIESCFECASACWICADAGLNEENALGLKECIKLSLTCAEVCATTAKVLISCDDDFECARAQLKACMDQCEMCMNECMKYSEEHEHCLICVKCCEACFKICESYFNEMMAA